MARKGNNISNLSAVPIQILQFILFTIAAIPGIMIFLALSLFKKEFFKYAVFMEAAIEAMIGNVWISMFSDDNK